jgi:hypothetical protein
MLTTSCTRTAERLRLLMLPRPRQRQMPFEIERTANILDAPTPRELFIRLIPDELVGWLFLLGLESMDSWWTAGFRRYCGTPLCMLSR